jgi:hypothetical protein
MKYKIGDEVEGMIHGIVEAVELQMNGDLIYRIRNRNKSYEIAYITEQGVFPLQVPEEVA